MERGGLGAEAEGPRLEAEAAPAAQNGGEAATAAGGAAPRHSALPAAGPEPEGMKGGQRAKMGSVRGETPRFVMVPGGLSEAELSVLLQC